MDKKNTVEKAKIIITMFEDENFKGKTGCEVRADGKGIYLLMALSALVNNLKEEFTGEALRAAFEFGIEPMDSLVKEHEQDSKGSETDEPNDPMLMILKMLLGL